MTKNPLINATAAFLYITTVVTFLLHTPKFEGVEGVGSVIASIAFLSLFVLSAATMAYIFCLTPIKLYIDGKREEAVSLFIRTLMYFALITMTIFVLLYVLWYSVPHPG